MGIEKVDNLKYNKMFEEFRKGRKFTEYVDKCMSCYGTALHEELRKVITWEYYKSVVEGVNKEC